MAMAQRGLMRSDGIQLRNACGSRTHMCFREDPSTRLFRRGAEDLPIASSDHEVAHQADLTGTLHGLIEFGDAVKLESFDRSNLSVGQGQSSACIRPSRTDMPAELRHSSERGYLYHHFKAHLTVRGDRGHFGAVQPERLNPLLSSSRGNEYLLLINRTGGKKNLVARLIRKSDHIMQCASGLGHLGKLQMCRKAGHTSRSGRSRIELRLEGGEYLVGAQEKIHISKLQSSRGKHQID